MIKSIFKVFINGEWKTYSKKYIDSETDFPIGMFVENRHDNKNSSLNIEQNNTH